MLLERGKIAGLRKEITFGISSHVKPELAPPGISQKQNSRFQQRRPKEFGHLRAGGLKTTINHPDNTGYWISAVNCCISLKIPEQLWWISKYALHSVPSFSLTYLSSHQDLKREIPLLAHATGSLSTETFSLQECFETSHITSMKHQATLHPEQWKDTWGCLAIRVVLFPGNSKRNSGNLMENMSKSCFFCMAANKGA